MICFDCNLPDPYNGQGDGIGSCDCHRCEACGGAPGHECSADWPDDVFITDDEVAR